MHYETLKTKFTRTTLRPDEGLKQSLVPQIDRVLKDLAAMRRDCETVKTQHQSLCLEAIELSKTVSACTDSIQKSEAANHEQQRNDALNALTDWISDSLTRMVLRQDAWMNITLDYHVMTRLRESTNNLYHTNTHLDVDRLLSVEKLTARSESLQESYAILLSGFFELADTRWDALKNELHDIYELATNMRDFDAAEDKIFSFEDTVTEFMENALLFHFGDQLIRQIDSLSDAMDALKTCLVSGQKSYAEKTREKQLYQPHPL